VTTFVFEPHELPTVTIRCEAADRIAAGNVVLARHGMTYRDRFGQPRVRPEVAVVRDAEIAHMRATRELRLHVAPDESRPPDLGGGRARA